MKPEIKLKKHKQRKYSLEYQLEQLVAHDMLDRDIDWFDEWTYLQSQIDRMTRLIAEQEIVCQASSR